MSALPALPEHEAEGGLGLSVIHSFNLFAAKGLDLELLGTVTKLRRRDGDRQS